MSTHDCTVNIGTHTKVSVNFNYTPSDPDCGLDAEIEINSIDSMFLNSIDDIMDDLNSQCIERIREECLQYMEKPK